MSELSKTLPPEQAGTLLSILKARYKQNPDRHTGLDWAAVQARLEAMPAKLWSLNEMERTGGEPDVAGLDQLTGEYLFFDFAAESPAGRRNLCYDGKALDSRKQNKPAGSAVGMAEAMGIALLTEEEYFALQQLGKFDQKTSSWVQTPEEIRKLGGALFCDRRYDHVFTYHNGADSYYGVRGFRGVLRV